MGNEEPQEHREIEEEMKKLGFKKFNLESHLELRKKLSKRQYRRNDDQK